LGLASKKSRNIAEFDAIGLDLYKQMFCHKKLGLDISLMMQKELAQSRDTRTQQPYTSDRFFIHKNFLWVFVVGNPKWGIN
jgi:hypothetical protein